MRSPAAMGTGLSRQGSDCSKGRSCSPSARDASVKSAKISVIVDRIGSMVQHWVRVADIYNNTCANLRRYWLSTSPAMIFVIPDARYPFVVFA
jgi:hypothetical protein